MKHLSRWKTVTATAATAAIAASALGIANSVDGDDDTPQAIELTGYSADEDGPGAQASEVRSNSRSQSKVGLPIVADDAPSTPVPIAGPESPDRPGSPVSPEAADGPSPASPGSPDSSSPVSSGSPSSQASPASADSPASVDSTSSIDS